MTPVVTSECACPSETLSFDCTVMDGPGGATIWNGSAFDCQGNEITLLHGLTSSGILGECNDGAIVGRRVSVEGNLYTSQLNVTVTPDMAGKNITCVYDAMTGRSSNVSIYLSAVIIIPGNFCPKLVRVATIHKFTICIGPFPPPSKFYISTADFVSKVFTFSWSPVAPECPAAIHYNILASNCGSCPTTTNHTTVTCTDVPINGSMCLFAIQAVVCENITGNTSDPIHIYSKNLIFESGTDTAYIASIIFLASAVIICIAVFITVIIIVSKRNIAKIIHLANRTEIRTDSVYEDVTDPLKVPPVRLSAINTQDNVAYGHAQT